MTSVTIDTEQEYRALVDDLAERAADDLIDSAGDERYEDDVVEGMKETVYDTVSSWWFDHNLGEATHHNIIKHGDTIAYDIASHVRSVAFSEDAPDGSVEVVPEDVQNRVALVTFRHDVVEHLTDEYEDTLANAAIAEE